MQAVIIYMAYSVMMSVVWILLQSPDLAITEAAVGAGITSILIFPDAAAHQSHRQGRRTVRRAAKGGAR